MALRKMLLTTAVFFMVAPVVPALAHDDDGYGDHWRFHDQLSEAHERAHEEGFWSRAEHRAYHRALRDLHDSYHDDHDGYSSYYARPRYYRSYGGW